MHRTQSQHSSEGEKDKNNASQEEATQCYGCYGTLKQRCQPAEGEKEYPQEDSDEVAGIARDILPKTIKCCQHTIEVT